LSFSAFWKQCSAEHLLHLVGTAVSLTLTFLVLWNPPLLNDLRLKSFDLLIEQMPAPLADPPVVIVDIDPKSLAEYGQWPWPRRRTAELINRIAAVRPTVIGLDIVFAEPDRTSPNRLADAEGDNMPAAVRSYLRGLTDHDQLLAGVLAASPVPVVVGHLFTNRGAASSKAMPQSGSFLLRGRDPLSFLHRFHEADVNLPILERAARGSGFFNIVPDVDAISRRLPLLISFKEELYPSLTLAMLQAAEGGAPVIVDSNENGVRMVQVGPYQIPTTMRGEMLVNFSSQPDDATLRNELEDSLPKRRSSLLKLLKRVISWFKAGLKKAQDVLPFLQCPGAAQEQAEPFRYISAADVLSGRASPSLLRKAYVLVGTSTLGLFDLIAAPVSETFPGVEFHGQALNTILTGSFLDRPKWVEGMEIVQLACIGLAMTVLLPRIGSVGGLLLACGAAGGSILFSLWNFRWNHLLVDMVTPTAASGLLFTMLTSFNYFVEERKTSRLRSAFSQYLAPAVVEELVKNQNSLVLSGEERELTILFSDIRGFTSMAEKMRPEALCAFLNEYLTPMTAAVMDRRGTVDKFIGDAVMAFWNAPLTTQSHARHACECALAMLKELESLNHSWLKRGLPTIHIGIGIHCGTARVGNMGSKQRFEYTVIGDTVNLASRLEGLTKLYGADILVSGAVHSALDQSVFQFRQVDIVRVVGKSEPVEVYQLLGKHRLAEHLSEDRLEEMRLHSKAFALYNAGNFPAAGQLFQQLHEQQPEDRLYRLYIERCGQLAANPPPNWDGITDMRSK
jgi:adenylate cyclase